MVAPGISNVPPLVSAALFGGISPAQNALNSSLFPFLSAPATDTVSLSLFGAPGISTGGDTPTSSLGNLLGTLFGSGLPGATVAPATPAAASSSNLGSLLGDLFAKAGFKGSGDTGALVRNAALGPVLGSFLDRSGTGSIIADIIGNKNTTQSTGNLLGSIFGAGQSPFVDSLLGGIMAGGGGGNLFAQLASNSVQMKDGKALILPGLLSSSAGRAEVLGGTGKVISGLFQSFRR